MEIKPVAYIKTDFPTKFGIPRQSGLIDSLESKIIFTPEYRDKNALRGIEDFSHLWLIWHFSENDAKQWSPTVRPPRLGGNKRVGVFATRSPNRPNPIGLSSVKLLCIEDDPQFGAVLIVSGADMLDGTPIFDIKPYLPISDVHLDAKGGFSDDNKDYCLDVIFPKELTSILPPEKLETVIGILKSDPRPAYHSSPERIYGFKFSEYEIKFLVENNTLTVVDIEKI